MSALLVGATIAACTDGPTEPARYTDEEIDYFVEIALGFEFGNASEIVRKWADDVAFQVMGTLTPADGAMLDDVVADVNRLTSTVDLVRVDALPSVEVHFAPVDSFPEILPSYVPGNIGFFEVFWGSDQHLFRAVVLIASDVSQQVRNHLIREEMTQMLGMGNDSDWYADSIFQQEFSLVSTYAPIDEAVIEILYRPEIRVGWDAATARDAARSLARGVLYFSPSVVASPDRAPAAGSPGSASGGHRAGR